MTPSLSVNAKWDICRCDVQPVISLLRISELKGSIYFWFGLYIRRAMSQVWWRRYSDSSSFWLKENALGEVRPPCGDDNAERAGFLVALGLGSPHCSSYHSHVQGGTAGHGSRFLSSLNPSYLPLPKDAECTAGRENSRRFSNYIEVIKEALREGYQDFNGWVKPYLFQQTPDLMDRLVTFYSAVVFNPPPRRT